MPDPSNVRMRLLFPSAAVCLSLIPGAGAQVLDRSIQLEDRIAQDAAQAQEQINQIDDETQRLVDEYQRVVNETDSLRIYNEQLQRIVDNQEREKESIHEQLGGLEQTSRDVVPLMIEMTETIKQLIQADMPFRREQRLDRADTLLEMLDRSDVTTSEKYRRILEAYQDEIEFGRTTEGYRGALPTGQQVEFLRIGRTLLFYQSLDGHDTGWWNPQTREFEELSDAYRLAVSDGLAIAKNQVAPDLVRLPVPAPKREQ